MIIKQENILLTNGYDEKSDKFSSTDNVTNLIGIGSDMRTALRDHIVELILYYEEKLNGNRRNIQD